MEIHEIKLRYTIERAWNDLGLQGEPSKLCRSPFRDDKHPSFSVYEEGRKANDFATGDHYDVIDFVTRSLNCPMPEAIRWIEDKLGMKNAEYQKREETTVKVAHQGCLLSGTRIQRTRLADLRGLTLEAVSWAERRGNLYFGKLFGFETWAITDSSSRIVEWRRADGKCFPAYGRLGKRKCHCNGKGKAFPVGLPEAEAFNKIAFCEGAPDFLAACHLIMVESKEETVAPVTMLGAANHRIDPDALRSFKGKHVRIYPHVDEAGIKAVRAWARQLKDAGATVDAFDLSGIELEDGSEGKDLNDLVNVNPDCWEKNEKFRIEIMP